MNKELEALERLKTAPSFMGGTVEYQACMQSEALLMQDYEIVKQALQRLESIDNAEPSEALECLEKVYSRLPQWDLSRNVDQCNIIKQALLKMQEDARSEEILQKYYQEGITLDSVRALKQERDNYKKILEIIKEKRVNVDLFWNDFIDNGFGYHYYLEKWYKYQSTDKQKLTEEEFDLVSAWAAKRKKENEEEM